MVHNADFAPNPDLGFSTSYLSGVGFKNFLKNLKDITGSMWKEVEATIAEYRPTIIGIYCCAPSYASANTVARIAKSISKENIVVLGGPHPTTVGAEALEDANVDMVVRGEGEQTIIEILDAFDRRETLEKIRGIAYRSDNEIVETGARECIENLDSLCFPHEYAMEVLKDYDEYPKAAFRDVFATRGCPYDCFFCGSRYIWGKKVRFRSAASVVSQIKSLQRMGLKWIEFGDDTFGVDKEYTKQLCESLIHDCHGIRWGCETRVDSIDEQTVALMKKAGCRSIGLGIESGNNEILRRIRKGATIEQTMTAADIIAKSGIKLTAYFIIGFPWETEDTLNDTFAAIQKIKGWLVYHIFTPYPGTEAFEFCKQAGLIDSNYNMTLYNHESPENCFCLNMKKERFREIASKIERYTDKHNAKQDLRATFSLSTLYKLHDFGLRASLRKLGSVVGEL